MNHLYAAHSFRFLLQERKKIQQKFFKLKAKKIGGSELFIELFVCIHKYNNTHTYTHTWATQRKSVDSKGNGDGDRDNNSPDFCL